MNKKERAAFIQKRLNHYFARPPIPLYHSNHFTLLIAVLLSARTTDAQVNKITPKLFAKANTAKAMTELTVEEIHRIIKTCGLAPSKAKNIHALAKILVEKHSGRVPETFKELEALPGVGHKTASVVMSQAFRHPTFPVDTHIHRCAKRWGLSKGTSVVQTERDLKRIFPKNKWNTLHLQIIYFGRAYCKAKGHKKERCPICSFL